MMKLKYHQITNVAACLVLSVVFVSGILGVASESYATQISQEASSRFAANLRRVFQLGEPIGNPEILQAILLQESNGGLSERIGNKDGLIRTRSYGLMQVQVVAARSMLQRVSSLKDDYFPDREYKSITDREIINLLLENDEANIKIAAHHFNLYLQLCKGDLDKAVAAYNVGIGGVKRIANPSTFAYVVAIKAKLKTVRPFNLLNGLELTDKY
jgi:hypothetical protein